MALLEGWYTHHSFWCPSQRKHSIITTAIIIINYLYCSQGCFSNSLASKGLIPFLEGKSKKQSFGWLNHFPWSSPQTWCLKVLFSWHLSLEVVPCLMKVAQLISKDWDSDASFHKFKNSSLSWTSSFGMSSLSPLPLSSHQPLLVSVAKQKWQPDEAEDYFPASSVLSPVQGFHATSWDQPCFPRNGDAFCLSQGGPISQSVDSKRKTQKARGSEITCKQEGLSQRGTVEVSPKSILQQRANKTTDYIKHKEAKREIKVHSGLWLTESIWPVRAPARTRCIIWDKTFNSFWA